MKALLYILAISILFAVYVSSIAFWLYPPTKKPQFSGFYYTQEDFDSALKSGGMILLEKGGEK